MQNAINKAILSEKNPIHTDIAVISNTNVTSQKAHAMTHSKFEENESKCKEMNAARFTSTYIFMPSTLYKIKIYLKNNFFSTLIFSFLFQYFFMNEIVLQAR